MPFHNAGEPILHAENLAKTYGPRTVVNQLNLDLHPGEIVGLLGPRGAGKTTALSMLMGLIRPNGGRVFLKREEVTRRPTHQRARIGLSYLPQGESNIPTLTAQENLLAILETQSLSQNSRQSRCAELLTQLGIAHVADRRALSLSKGERRRLSLARCLLNHPNVLLLDEPFAGLDSNEVEELQQHIARLRDAGLAIMIADSNVHEALQIVDRAYLIFEGKVIVQGTKDYLLGPLC